MCQRTSTVPYSTVMYSTIQCSTVQYCTVQYSTVHYSARKQWSFWASILRRRTRTRGSCDGWLPFASERLLTCWCGVCASALVVCCVHRRGSRQSCRPLPLWTSRPCSVASRSVREVPSNGTFIPEGVLHSCSDQNEAHLQRFPGLHVTCPHYPCHVCERFP